MLYVSTELFIRFVYFSVNMFVVSIISEGILLQLTDHLLFGESDPASFALQDKLLTRITLLYIGRLVSNNLCHHEWSTGARAINYMSLVSPGCLNT